MKLDIGGVETVQVAVEELRKALNDPAVLTRCIPGSKTVTEIAHDAYEVEMQLRDAFGGSFEGEISLADKTPPIICSMKVSGAGTLGHENGSARFEIAPEGSESSRLTFHGIARSAGWWPESTSAFQAASPTPSQAVLCRTSKRSRDTGQRRCISGLNENEF